MDNQDFRTQMANNALGMGVAGQGRHEGMLTPQAIAETQKNEKFVAILNGIVKEGVDKGLIKSDDPLFISLKNFFVGTAKTERGIVDALRMAIFTTSRINKEFTVEKKKE